MRPFTSAQVCSLASRARRASENGGSRAAALLSSRSVCPVADGPVGRANRRAEVQRGEAVCPGDPGLHAGWDGCDELGVSGWTSFPPGTQNYLQARSGPH